MDVRTYKVRSMAEALQVISDDLGPDAAMLHSRKLTAGFWEWWTGPQWEVVAACDPNVLPRFERDYEEALVSTHQDRRVPMEALAESHVDPNRASTVADGFPVGKMCRNTADARETVSGDKTLNGADLITSPVDSAKTGGGKLPLNMRQTLSELGVSSATIDRLGRDLLDEDRPEDRATLWSALCRGVTRCIPFVEPIEIPTGTQVTAALVGPTGVGKTTTIAKLAADFQLRLGKRVGLITLDTFRVGAVDQLKTYADILGAPLEVVDSPTSMKLAKQRLADCDLILIDTVGRSPRDSRQLDSLAALLQIAAPDHLMVTLSATTDEQGWEHGLNVFSQIATTAEISIIVTKIDECWTLADHFGRFKSLRYPWRYWTNGQRVPDDLGLAGPEIAAWLVSKIESQPVGGDSAR